MDYVLGMIYFIKKKKKKPFWSSRCRAVETNLTRNPELVGLIPDLAQWVKDPGLPWPVL